MRAFYTMRLISSKLSVWNKRFVPVFWCGFIALVAWALALNCRNTVWIVAIPAALAVLGLAYMRMFTLAIADEAFDAGNAVIIRSKGKELSIPLANITSVKYALVADPPRIILSFSTAAVPRATVQFMPPVVPAMFLFREHPLAAELRKRTGGRPPCTKIRD